MKRLLAMILSVILIFSLAACGGNSGSSAEKKEEAKETDVPETEQEPAADAETEPAGDAGETASVSDRTEVLTLRWGATGTGNEDDVQWVYAEPVIKEIEEKSGGMIKFEYYPSSQLGAEASMLDQVTLGTLDVCVVNPNTLSTIWPDTVLMNYPFAYPSVEVYWDTWEDPDLFDAMYEAIAANNSAVWLGSSTTTYRGCQNATRAIHNVKDMEGLTFRTMAGQIYVDIFGAMGAATASVSASEVFTAIQQGLVDGEETAVSFCYDNGYWEAEKYATELNAVMSTSQLMVSAETWAKLTPAEQELFRSASANGRRERMCSFYNDTTDYYYEQLADKGLEVVRYDDMSQEDQQSFVDAVMPLWDQYKETVDPEIFDLWVKACSAAWEKNGYTWTYEAN